MTSALEVYPVTLLPFCHFFHFCVDIDLVVKVDN
jgi:hypothetical protein